MEDQQSTDEYWMRHALDLANRAQQIDEVPVGAVLVKNGEIIGYGWNQPISTNDPSAHAEIIALRSAGVKISNYRLLNTTLYVTLEPCVMCVGAMMHARIQRLVYGASDPKTGAVGSQFDLLSGNQFNHQIVVTPNILSEPCSALLRQFFKAKRKIDNTQ